MEKTEILSPESIHTKLNKIHIWGRKGAPEAETLLRIVSKKDEWSHEQGMLFYENILQYYLGGEPDKLEMMLAVSGRLTGYENKTTATKCRERFFNEKNIIYSDDSQDKKEKHILQTIAKRLYTDIQEENFPPFLKEWMSIKEPTLIKPQKPRISIINFIEHSLKTNPIHWLISTAIVFLILGWGLRECILKMKPPVEKIIIPSYDIEVEARSSKYLCVIVEPKTADKDSLHCEVSNPNLIAVEDWHVISLCEWQEDMEHTATITIRGKNNLYAQIHVDIVPELDNKDTVDFPQEPIGDDEILNDKKISVP